MYNAQTLFGRNSLFNLLAPAVLIAVAGCGSGIGSGFNWTIGGGDRQTIQVGQQATWDIDIQSKTDIETTVTLRVEGVPPGATASFDPANLGTTGNESTLTIETEYDTPVGSYTISVYASEVGVAEYGPITKLLIVTGEPGAVDFSLEVTPLQHTFTSGGGSPTITFYVRPLNGFLGTVNISVAESSPFLQITTPPTPPSLTYTNSGGKGGTFVLSCEYFPPGTPPVDVIVTATSGAIVHSQTLRVHFGE